MKHALQLRSALDRARLERNRSGVLCERVIAAALLQAQLGEQVLGELKILVDTLAQPLPVDLKVTVQQFEQTVALLLCALCARRGAEAHWTAEVLRVLSVRALLALYRIY